MQHFYTWLQRIVSHPVLPLDPGGEAVGQFVEGTRILAFNLAPAPKVIGQFLQLLALLLQLQVKYLQLVHKLTTHLCKESREKIRLLKWFAGGEKTHMVPFPLYKNHTCWQLFQPFNTKGLQYLWFVSHSQPIQRALSGVLHEKSFLLQEGTGSLGTRSENIEQQPCSPSPCTT